MPSQAHEQAHLFWSTYLVPVALGQLTVPPFTGDIKCSGAGSTSTFNDNRLYILSLKFIFFQATSWIRVEAGLSRQMLG